MQVVLTVPKLACSACVETIAQAVRQRDPQAPSGSGSQD